MYFAILFIILNFLKFNSFFLIDTNESSIERIWTNFKLHNQQTFVNNQQQYHREVLIENIKKINKHNIEYYQGLHTFKLGINKFIGMTQTEFSKKYKLKENYILTHQLKKTFKNNNNKLLSSTKYLFFPQKLNWTELGIVSEVKNQGSCGSCWAFSAAGSLESIEAKITGVLKELSVQQLIDCDYSNYGCEGGYMHNAFTYIKKNNWLAKNQDYAYTGIEGKCKQGEMLGSDFVVENFNFIEFGNEEQLKEYLLKVGPITIAIDKSKNGNLMHYSEGIYTDLTCSSENLNHAMLLVGYGSEYLNNELVEYWIVKNSWGSEFGEMGYIRLRRNYNNMCGVASMAGFATIKKNEQNKKNDEL